MMQKIYIGPTIPGVVTNGTIFKDKLPEHIEKTKTLQGLSYR